MELTDGIVNRFGADKVMHFLSGALICAVVTFVVILQDGGVDWMTALMPVTGIVFAGFIAVCKEAAFDAVFDWKDVIATLLGCIPVWVSVVIGIVFNYLSK